MRIPQSIQDATAADLAEVRVILFDVDNTLVGNESPDLPSEKFQNLSKQLANFVSIGLASARPLSKVQHILDACDMEGYSILSNGAHIYDGAQKKLVVEHLLPVEPAKNIMRYLQERDVYHWCMDDSVDHFWQGETAASDNKHLGTYARAVDIWDTHSKEHEIISDYEPAKPITIVAKHVSAAMRDELLAYGKQFAHDDIVCILVHESELDGEMVYDLFFTHKYTNKRDALKTLSDLSGIPAAHYMAVGDGHNDKVVIEHVGYGVAMGNAVQEVKDAARYITSSYDDDGAARVLEVTKKGM